MPNPHFSSSPPLSDATSEALAQLRDIHLPEAVSWWPIAPGWYLLAIIITLMVLMIIFYLRKCYLNQRPKRQALRLLSAYQQSYQQENNAQLSAARVSELLKRVALVYFPREDVASLQGEAWIIFLNHSSKGLDFNLVRKELLEVPYQSDINCNLQTLFNLSNAWVKQRRGRCLN